MLITCAGEGRKEHGTHNNHPGDSPGTNDYYKNISTKMFAEVLPANLFTDYHLVRNGFDLQFFGIKNS